MSSQEAITQFVTLFVVIDPAATIALFLLTVRGLTRTQARLVAMIAAVIAFVVRLFFVAFFELLREAMHVPLSSFSARGLDRPAHIRPASGSSSDSGDGADPFEHRCDQWRGSDQAGLRARLKDRGRHAAGTDGATAAGGFTQREATS